MNDETELRHLDQGARPGETPDGLGLVAADCLTTGEPAAFLDACREVMRATLTMTEAERAAEPSQPVNLPAWFVQASGPEQSEEEDARWLEWWRGLPPEEQERAEREVRWSISGWLEWLEPDTRTWYWWDAEVIGDHQARVLVQIPDWPVPLAALEWLLRAAGAKEIVIDELYPG